MWDLFENWVVGPKRAKRTKSKNQPTTNRLVLWVPSTTHVQYPLDWAQVHGCQEKASSCPPGFWAFSRFHWYLSWSAWVTSKSDIENDLSRLCHQLCDMGSSCLSHYCFPQARLELKTHQTFSALLRNGFVVCAIKSLSPASLSPVPCLKPYFPKASTCKHFTSEKWILKEDFLIIQIEEWLWKVGQLTDIFSIEGEIVPGPLVIPTWGSTSF